MKKTLILLLAMILLPLAGWCADGDTFTVTTAEGQTMTVMVLSEADKTCQVGKMALPALIVAMRDLSPFQLKPMTT